MDVSKVPLNFREHPECEMVVRAAGFRDKLVKRRSDRDFSNRLMPSGVLEARLEAAVTASNGANLQPRHFAIIRDPSIKKTICPAAEEEEPKFHEARVRDESLDALAPIGTDAQKPFLETASAFIAILQKSEVIREDRSKSRTSYVKESVSLAIGCLIAALHHAGLATSIHTPSPMKFLNVILGRFSTEKPFLLLVVGFPSDNCQAPDI